MFAHDGKSIRTEEMNNFLVLYLNGTSVNQEVRNRIRESSFLPRD